MITSTAALTLLSKVIAPVINELYQGAKGKVSKELEKWAAPGQIRKIAKTLTKIESVKTIWSRDKEVLIQDFYYPSKIFSKKITSLQELPEGNIIVQGIVGQGKSIFMRYLASQAIRNTQQTVLPIFLELRTISTKINLSEAINRYFRGLDIQISEESFSYLANSGKIVLLLDGFDEITDSLVKETIEEIELISTRYPDLKIIASSRPSNEIQKITGFRTLNLDPLLPKDYQGFLEKLGLTSIKKHELVEAIKQSPSNVSGIITTPLMLTLVVTVYESEKEIPPTLPEFFERLFQAVFTNHDRLKAGFSRTHYCGLSERRLQLLFEAFCFMCIREGYSRSLSNEQFNKAFEGATVYKGETCGVENFRKDITKVACLMLEEGIDLTTFLHKSIMEYYAAAFIMRCPEEVAQLFYRQVNNSYRQWKETLSFLTDIDPYRFSKFYQVDDIKSVLIPINGLIENKNSVQLRDFIHSHHPEIGIDIEMHGTEFEIASYGPIEMPNSMTEDLLLSKIMESMESTVTKNFTFREARAIALNESDNIIPDKDSDSIVHITCKALIKNSDCADFWGSFESLSAELKASLDRAEKKISLQESLKNIFMDLTITTER